MCVARQRALASQLGEYIEVYNLETRRLAVVAADATAPVDTGALDQQSTPTSDFKLFLQLARCVLLAWRFDWLLLSFFCLRSVLFEAFATNFPPFFVSLMH